MGMTTNGYRFVLFFLKLIVVMVVQCSECTENSLNYVLYMGELCDNTNYISIKLLRKDKEKEYTRYHMWSLWWTTQVLK